MSIKQEITATLREHNNPQIPTEYSSPVSPEEASTFRFLKQSLTTLALFKRRHKNIQTSDFIFEDTEASKEARRIWTSLVRQDPQVREALRVWKWRDKNENCLQFNKAFTEAITEGVSTLRFIQGAKLCVMEGNKWSYDNLMSYARLKEADGIALVSSVVNDLVIITEDDLQGYDFSD